MIVRSNLTVGRVLHETSALSFGFSCSGLSGRRLFRLAGSLSSFTPGSGGKKQDTHKFINKKMDVLFSRFLFSPALFFQWRLRNNGALRESEWSKNINHSSSSRRRALQKALKRREPRRARRRAFLFLSGLRGSLLGTFATASFAGITGTGHRYISHLRNVTLD